MFEREREREREREGVERREARGNFEMNAVIWVCALLVSVISMCVTGVGIFMIFSE